jgi:hypothetical protein
MLRCLTIRCLVARHTDNGDARYSSVRQLFHVSSETRYAWTDPFHSGSFLSGAALQRPVKSQQAKRLDQLLISSSRHHGALKSMHHS